MFTFRKGFSSVCALSKFSSGNESNFFARNKIKKIAYFNKLFCFSVSYKVKHSTMNISSVIKEFEKVAPLGLAESWDNVGLLVEPVNEKPIKKILLTNDLTLPVLNEAIESNADMIFSYHPPIFTPLKRLLKAEWKHHIILSCIEKQIAIYSSHTALDASMKGVNDWLISCFELESVKPLLQSSEEPEFNHIMDCETVLNVNFAAITELPGVQVISETHNNSNTKKYIGMLTKDSSVKSVVEHMKEKDYAVRYILKCEKHPMIGYGMGRFGKLSKPIQLQEAISIVKKHTGLKNLRVAFAIGHDMSTSISSVAVCAGSGTTVLKNANAELYVTGEMSHHELLDASHRGKTVILCEHSNSERGFLKSFVSMLQPELPGIQLLISKKDADPVTIV